MKSMTGHGVAEGNVGRGRLYVEIKSINHRFNEIIVKIPGRMSILESNIRKHLQNRFYRGKIDVFFKEKEPLFGGVTVSIDTELAVKYKRAIQKLRKDLNLEGNIDYLQTIGLDRIIRTEEKAGSYEKLWRQISKLLNRATANVEKMRVKEGAYILRDQRKRIIAAQSMIKKIRKRSGTVRTSHVEKIRNKLSCVIGTSEIDEQRLQLEAAYLGGRQDIAEEVVRLESHTKQYLGMLGVKKPIGRKLDFLLQEMNREVNTIGAKAADAKISQMVVECKSEIERLKEQVQNIE